MTAKTKSIVIIIGTLIVGIIIGALATGSIFFQRVAEIQALRDENGMALFLERVIEPTDEAQQAQIKAVLKKTAGQQMEIRKSVAQEHRKIFEDLRQELGEILTLKQKKELRQWMEHDRRRRPGWPPPEFMRREGDTRFERVPFDSTARRKPRMNRHPDTNGKALPADSTSG